MNVIFPIHKKYADKIFDKTKPVEFRHRLPNIEIGDKIYVYETKKNGCGKIVGYFTVKNTNEINPAKMGTYMYMKVYADMFFDLETQRLVNKALTIDLKDCYNDLVISYLFMEECLDEMLKTKRPPETSDNMILYDINKYLKLKKKQNNFLNGCDNWLRDIGFYNEIGGDSSNWEYEIWIDKVEKFENPIPITEFCNKNREKIQKAPQSYCYTLTDI